MLRISSRFTSTGLFLTENDSPVSVTLFSLPSTVFPSFSFTDRRLAEPTVLSRDQSLVDPAGAFASWAASVRDGNNKDAARAMLIVRRFLRKYIEFSLRVSVSLAWKCPLSRALSHGLGEMATSPEKRESAKSTIYTSSPQPESVCQNFGRRQRFLKRRGSGGF